MLLSKKQYSVEKVCCEEMAEILKDPTQFKVVPETGEFYLKIAGELRQITACFKCFKPIRTKRGFFNR